jgi:hypothetical protein
VIIRYYFPDVSRTFKSGQRPCAVAQNTSNQTHVGLY